MVNSGGTLKVQSCKLKKHRQMIAYMFQTCPENFTFQLFLILRNLPLKFAIFLTVSIVFFVYKQNITVQ